MVNHEIGELRTGDQDDGRFTEFAAPSRSH